MSWTAEYFQGSNFSGGNKTPGRVEAGLSISNQDQLPKEVLTKQGNDNVIDDMSARFVQTINGPGKYEISTQANARVRVFVDGATKINQWPGTVGIAQAQTASSQSITMQLSPGPHNIRVEYSYPMPVVVKVKMRLPAILTVNIKRVGGQDQREIELARRIVAAPGKATRGGLVPARFYEVDDDGEPVYGSRYPIFYCMFNPDSYSIKKSSSFVGKGLDENKNYALLGEKTKSKPRQLMLKEIWLDTTELIPPHWRERDVSKYTDLLLEMAESTAAKYSPDFRTADTSKATPPKLAFRWGNFRFLGLLEKVKIKFTHFAHDGTPQRAKVSLMFKEFRHRRVYPPQNPSSGGDGRVERAWEIKAGDRLDSIAAQVYGDAAQWRLLANFNNIANPLVLQPGVRLLIPALKKRSAER